MDTKTKPSSVRNRSRHSQVVVIGAGASGLTAAIAAARGNAEVLILERLNTCARKVLASGGGKCNLLNRQTGEHFFNPAGRPLVKEVFQRYPAGSLLAFFSGLGLQTYADGERLFPRSNQAATVVKILELELQRLRIPVEYGCPVTSIHPSGSGFKVNVSSGQPFTADRLVLAAGGASYPALGSNGSGFQLARQMEHTIITPVPAAVPLVVKDKLCHVLQGQKLGAQVRALCGQNVIAESTGELLFTQYGFSGTAVLDVSREISVVLNRHSKGDIVLEVDFVPWMGRSDLTVELMRKIAAGYQPQELLVGILPNKVARAMAPGNAAVSAADLAQAIKARHFAVNGTRGWNEAEFTAGGVDTAEVDPRTLASRRHPGLFFCGEVLDVDGRRGGHNFAWAWASGLLAGSCAAVHKHAPASPITPGAAGS